MYKPRRDERFEYIWEAMRFIEDSQCKTCAFSKKAQDPDNEPHSSQYPMCYEIEAVLLQERPVEELEDAGLQGIICTKYRDVSDYTYPDPMQGALFE